MYDIRRLRMLVEIKERGTLAAAARVLHLTPSAISQQMAALEKEVGSALIHRVGRKVQLTEAGMILVDGAQAIMREMDATATRLAQLSGEASGKVRLAIFQSVAISLLTPTLQELRQKAPKVTLEVQHIDPESGLALTKSREFDLVIAEAYPHLSIPEYPELKSDLLVKDPIHLVVPEDSEITSLTEAASMPFVLEGRHNSSRTWAVNQCRAAGFEPVIRYEIEDLLTHVSLVKAGFAVAMLPALVTSSLRDKSGIRIISIGAESYRDIVLASRIDTATQPALLAVQEALKVACDQLQN